MSERKMKRHEIMQRLSGKIMAAVTEALNAEDLSSKDVAGAILGFGVGALKAEGLSKKDILTEIEGCFDETINYGPLGRGGSA
jgi:hypothetical protein